jgi:hypothetical protein
LLSLDPLQDSFGSVVSDALHIPGTDDKWRLFAGLLDVDNVAELFRTGELSFGEDAIGARFFNGSRESLTYLSGSLKDAMGDGWTIQLHQPQRFEDNLWRMVAACEASMGQLVGCNAYLTPKNTQGLAPHWDDVNVAILQLYGDKDWSVWRCDQRMSYPSGDLDPRALGEPYLEVRMRPGDVLILPRGYIHQARAGDADTGHLTLSWGQQCDVMDVISKTIEAAMILPPFQLQLPPALKSGVPMVGMGKDISSMVTSRLRDLADHLESHPEIITNGYNAMSHDFMTSRLPPHPCQLSQQGTGEMPEGESDQIELIGDYFCILKDTPSTDLCLNSSNGVVDVSFEGDEDIRIMSSVGNSRQTHMMGVGGGCDDSECEDEGCCGDHDMHDHGQGHHHSHDEGASDEEEEDEEDEGDGDDDVPGGSLIMLPQKFKAAVEGVFQDRCVAVRDLECAESDKMRLAGLLCQLGLCRSVSSGKKKVRKE